MVKLSGRQEKKIRIRMNMYIRALDTIFDSILTRAEQGKKFTMDELHFVANYPDLMKRAVSIKDEYRKKPVNQKVA